MREKAISVAVAVGEVADTLVERLASRVKALRVGEGHEEGAEMGPVITRMARGSAVRICSGRVMRSK